MSKVPGYYTTAEVMEMFGWSRSAASQAARRFHWQLIRIGNAHLYDAGDVDEYADARWYGDALRKLGAWTRVGPYWGDELIYQCPNGCGHWAACNDDLTRWICPSCGEFECAA